MRETCQDIKVVKRRELVRGARLSTDSISDDEGLQP